MDNIKVGIRVRPLHEREKESVWIIENNTISPKNNRQICYSFDHVFKDTATTEDIYDVLVKSIVESVVEGINGTIFAYGQTNSGKTYTMTGENEELGIIPHCIIDMLGLINQRTDREFLIRVSFMEIYNESIIDLLNTTSLNLQIRDGEVGAARVTNLIDSPCVGTEDIINILLIGNDNRTIGATAMNQKSSRSHSIFTISLESRLKLDKGGASVRISSLNLVDLAGSERTSTSGTESNFKEGVSINLSLFTLGNVISKLSKATTGVHIPYRESTLTRILQPSLGGNAKTAIICTISPTSLEESHSALRFATRAKKIKNKPVVNEVDIETKKQLEVLILQNEVLTKRLEESCSEKEKTALLGQLEDQLKETRTLENQVKILQNYIVTSNEMFDDVPNPKQISRGQTICPGFRGGPKTPESVRIASRELFRNSPIWKGLNQPEVSDRREISRKKGVSFLPSRVSICSSTSDEFDDYLEPLLVEKVDDYTQAEISGHDLNLEIRLFESESPPSSHRHISNLSEDKKYQVQVKKLEACEHEIDELQQIKKHWEEEYSQNCIQIVELSNELDRKDDELEQMKRKIEQNEEIHNEDKICLKKYQEENSTLVNEKTVIEKQLQVQVKKLEDHEHELQQIIKHWEGEYSQNCIQIVELSNELDRKDDELEQMKRKDQSGKEIEQLRKKIVLLKQDHDVIEKRLKQEYKDKMEENRKEKRLLEEKLQEKVDKYEEEIPELKEQIEHLVIDFHKHQNQIVELGEELDEKDEALDKLRKKLNETENVKPQEVHQLVKQLEDELKKRNNSIQSLEEEVFQLRKKSSVKPPVSTENLAQQVYELRTDNELLKRKLRQMERHEKKLKDEFISLREALKEESKELGRYRAERNKYRVKYDTLKNLTGGKGVSDLMATQSTGESTGVSDLMGAQSTGVSDLMGTQRTESTNEENKKPESPPPFSIPDTGLISVDWEPSILDPDRIFTFSDDNTPPPKRTDCKQQ